MRQPKVKHTPYFFDSIANLEQYRSYLRELWLSGVIDFPRYRRRLRMADRAYENYRRNYPPRAKGASA